MTLDVESLSHQYGTERALNDVSFGLESGELVALVGPSGCGKTTLVQAIAGHISPTSGRVRLRGEDVTDQPPEARRVGLVFQQSTLYPHMTVGENVAYGLTAGDIDPDEREAIVAEYLDLVDLADQREAYPGELSGGQGRRVELARALAPQPDVLLLDEPLSALDRSLRLGLREEIARIQRETGVTTLFVTHDQEEAMSLADRLVVMNEGSVAAVGQPRELYESPPTPFVASFLGRSTGLTATVVDSDPLRIVIGEHEIPIQDTLQTPPAGTTLRGHLRPQSLSIGSPREGEFGLSGTVRRVRDLGRRYDVTVRTETGTELLVEQHARPPAVDESVTVAVPKSALQLFDQTDDTVGR
ncbi:ABC transporter ATP-binding protein [Halalkalirubrum salinum]|uniref:ABC transporter ATP-binding protein n=1 Tax=Halalkalirubrum salinum TaxID=2563889 RepID=UPI0010FB4EF2|nr:ABC transporter ATP-binding protein [Halalkalirubrum salinum]